MTHARKRKSAPDRISELTTNRLSVYLRGLTELSAQGVTTISSRAFAEQVNLNAAQIRKDLGYFGEFGVRGIGSSVQDPGPQCRRSARRRGSAARPSRGWCRTPPPLRSCRGGTVPAAAAQRVLDQVMAAGIRAVLNFSPGTLKVPARVKLKSVDLTVSLGSLSYYLANSGPRP